MAKTSRPITRDIYLRRRLFKRLDRLRRFPVIWVTAPPGAGKTALVSSYIGDRNVPCLWYRLDQGDMDPGSFFYAMGEASRKVLPEKDRPLPLLTPEYIHNIATFGLRFFEQLYDYLTPPYVIVFENYQDFPPDALLHDIIYGAFSTIPEGVNALVISRNDLPAPLSRLRANRCVGFLEWKDLRLTETEAMEITRCWTGHPPSRKTVHQLHRLSGGWAAGLSLLHEAFRKNAVPSCFTEAQGFEEVFDYFTAEIFRNFDAVAWEFFLVTAFLPKMTVPMAQALTENPAAGEILKTLNRNNCFVMRHDSGQIIYEIHPLCRRFLLNQAASRLSSRQLADIRRKAAVILDRADMTEDAITLLKETEAWDIMSGIIDARATGMLKQGRHRLLQRWLNCLPGTVREENPWLLFWNGACLLAYAPETAGPHFEKAFERFKTAGESTGEMLAASGMITAIAYAFNDFSPLDHWHGILNHLALKNDEFPDEETEAWVVSSLVIAGILREFFSSETDKWERRALEVAETTPIVLTMKANAVRFIFWRRLMWRGCHEALPILKELCRLSRVPGAPPMVSIDARTAVVQYHLFTGHHDKLLKAAREGLEISKKNGIHIEETWFRLYMAMSFAGRMQDKDALALVEEISPSIEKLPTWGKSFYHLLCMRISMVRKEYDAARFEGERAITLAARAGSPLSIACFNLLMAQLFFSLGDMEKASAYIDQARPRIATGQSSKGHVEVLKNDALLAFFRGEESRGIELLRQSLELSGKCGYFCLPFDNPPLTVMLCEKALEAGIEVAHVQAIIRRRGFIPQTAPIHLENWPWALKFYTLGRFTIIKNGEPMAFSGKAQQMPLRLLKLLIALGGRGVAVSILSEFLWPDVDGDLAHRSFGTTLHRLRKLIGHPEAIHLSDSRLTLDSCLCWVDTWAFERLSTRADDHEKQGAPEKAWETMEKALALYRRDFLSGEDNEPWAISNAERLKAKYFRKLLWLGRSLEEAKQYERAIWHYERGLEIDDCMEEVYQRLMRTFSCLGEKGKALATYRRCRKVLLTSLGIAPSPETETIHAALLLP